MLKELYKRIQHCCATLRWSRNKRNVGSCWLKSLTGFKLCATTCNRMWKRTQHITFNDVGSCWSTMLRPFARSLIPLSFGAKQLARSQGSFQLAEEDLRNEVGAKYAFLNWPIDIDACSHGSFDTQVDRAFNEFFSSFNPFNHILLVLFYLYNQLK